MPVTKWTDAVAKKKKIRQLNFSPSSPPVLLLLSDPGSDMDKNQGPGSGINIPDPQHWRI
jgi:hypothetical protein